MRRFGAHRIELSGYALIVLFVGASAFQHPNYNWDLIGYTASILELDGKPPQAIHEATFEALRRALPVDRFRELTTSDGYRREVFEHPDSLVQQIPFYTNKPGYLLALSAMRFAGLSIPRAAVLTSIASYCLICALIWIWTARAIRSRLMSFGLATLLALSPPVALAAGLSTPDALSSALVLAGLYFVLERRLVAIGLATLFVSLFVRTDNLIICLLLCGFLAIAHRSAGTVVRLAAFGIACGGVVMSINQLTHNYGWQTLVYHTFIAPLSSPAEVKPILSRASYGRVLISGFSSLHYSYAVGVLLFFLSGAVALHAVGYRLVWSAAARGTALIALSITIHFLMFPVLWDRYMCTRMFSDAAAVATVKNEVGNGELAAEEDLTANLAAVAARSFVPSIAVEAGGQRALLASISSPSSGQSDSSK
jgi:hypothetical protein